MLKTGGHRPQRPRGEPVAGPSASASHEPWRLPQMAVGRRPAPASGHCGRCGQPRADLDPHFSGI